MTDFVPMDVMVLRQHGCDAQAERAMDVHIRNGIRIEVQKLATEWRSGNRGKYADKFDAIARAIYEERYPNANKQQGREAATGQAKPQEGKSQRHKDPLSR